MDDEQGPGGLEKAWALAGMLAGAVLVWMALDVLRGRGGGAAAAAGPPCGGGCPDAAPG
jgi:hypothetical protein